MLGWYRGGWNRYGFWGIVCNLVFELPFCGSEWRLVRYFSEGARSIFFLPCPALFDATLWFNWAQNEKFLGAVA